MDKRIWSAAAWIGGIAIVVFARAIGRFAGRSAVDGFEGGKRDRALESAVAQVAADIRAQAPVKLDAITTLTGALSSGKGLIYLHTIELPVTGFDQKAWSEAMSRSLVQKVCTSSDMKLAIEHGAFYVYQYSSTSDGALIASVKIDQCPT